MSARRYKNAKLSESLLKQLNACDDGIDFVIRNKLSGFPLVLLRKVKGDYENYFAWIRRHKYIYTDKNNNLRRVVSKNGEECIYEYDIHGNMLRENIDNNYLVVKQYNENNDIISLKTSNDEHIIYEYDSKFRLVLTHDITNDVKTINVYDDYNYIPDDYTTVNYYNIDGNIVKTINKDLGITNYVYDSNKKLTRIFGESGLFDIRYYFDNDGNLVEYIDNTGRYIIKYNDGSTTTISPDKTVVTRKHDDIGNEIYYEDSNGMCMEMKYDTNNNVILKNVKGVSTTISKYDDRNNLIYRKINDIVELDIKSDYYENGQLKQIGSLLIPFFNYEN